jgi:hypothetical protein
MRLMLAVLEDAVDCICKFGLACNSRQRRLFEDALEWVRSDSAEPPFAFRCIYEVLGFDASHLRRGLLRSTVKRPPAPSSEFVGVEVRT